MAAPVAIAKYLEPNDEKESAYWYQLAADHGSPEAMLLLSSLYAEGRGVAQSFDRALSCLLTAAERLANPLPSLAEWVDRECLSMTTSWYRKAAELSVGDAQYILANRLMPRTGGQGGSV